MKLEERVFMVSDHIWEDGISVVITNSAYKSVKRQVKKNGLPKRYIIDKDATACVIRIKPKHGGGLWVVLSHDTTPDIIAHECVHLAFHLLHRRGLYLTKSAQEAYAYTIGWLFNKLTEFVASARRELSPDMVLEFS